MVVGDPWLCRLNKLIDIKTGEESSEGRNGKAQDKKSAVSSSGGGGSSTWKYLSLDRKKNDLI